MLFAGLGSVLEGSIFRPKVSFSLCGPPSRQITYIYYVALSNKDWELPNSRIWLTEMDIDRGLDFPI